jgi:hypothetical protein
MPMTGLSTFDATVHKTNQVFWGDEHGRGSGSPRGTPGRLRPNTHVVT